MSLKTFDTIIKYHGDNMLPLNIKEVLRLKNEHLTHKDWGKADKILRYHGYGELLDNMVRVQRILGKFKR